VKTALYNHWCYFYQPPYVIEFQTSQLLKVYFQIGEYYHVVISAITFGLGQSNHSGFYCISHENYCKIQILSVVCLVISSLRVVALRKLDSSAVTSAF
jgi:hypothetical protein